MIGEKHIKDDYTTETCHARVKCPFSHRGHYNNTQEAEKVSQKMLEEKYYQKALTPITAITSSPLPIEKEALKKLDAKDLAQILQNLANEENYGDSLKESIELATKLHADQKRFNRGQHEKTPYIEHPLRNAVRITRWGVKDKSIINATVLHDTIEDGSLKYAEIQGKNKPITEIEARKKLTNAIKSKFGTETVRLVEAVTNDPKEEQEKPKTQAEKASIYHDHLEKNITDSSTYLVKLSDFIDNASGLYHNDLPERKDKIKRMAEKYYPVIETFENKMNLTDEVLTKEVQASITAQLARTRVRLNKIINRPTN